VVAKVSADDGIGGRKDTSYKYFDWRVSNTGRGGQGFAQVEVTDPSGIIATNSYHQSYPLTGRLWSIVKKHPDHGTISETTTEYSLVNLSTRGGVAVSYFVAPHIVTDVAYLSATQKGAKSESVTTTSKYEYDGYGNPTLIMTTTTGADGESYERRIENTYGQDGTTQEKDEERMGKVTRTVTKSTKTSTDGSTSSVTRTTTLQYALLPAKSTALPLAKKKVQEGTAIEQHTAYGYDKYGHVTTTTVCASDFDSCTAGATNPGDSSEPNHPPFRTTSVSYDPTQYPGGAQTLSYGNGRYPVSMTNSAGQVEYAAYNALFGAIARATDRNGVSTCYSYDSLGWKTTEISRCGATKDGVSLELRTEYTRFRAASSDATYAAIVTVTSPPDHSDVWSYTDGLGRTVEILGRSFDGGFVETLTEYDHLGRVARTSRPFFPGASKYWTTTEFDWLSRPWRITQELGILDGAPSPTAQAGKVVQTLAYDGSSITTTETLADDRTRSRTERKNSLGKVSKAVDAKGSSIYYSYDSEGNLTDTHMLTPVCTSTTIPSDTRLAAAIQTLGTGSTGMTVSAT
jgi:hypothetical protein